MRQSVTAVTVCRDEATTVGESIESIRPFVDEVVVVDHGSIDESRDILSRLATSHGVHVIRRESTTPYSECRNLAVAQAKTDWILKWDADFIAYDAANGCKTSMRTLIDEHLPNLHRDANMVLIHCPNCGPTLDTALRGDDVDGVHGDIMVMRKEIAHWTTGKFADTFAPKQSLHRIYLNTPESPAFLIQVDRLKLPERLLLRDQMFRFDIARAKEAEETFDAWLRRAGWKSVDAGIDRLLARMSEQLMEFDFDRWGPHPAGLRKLGARSPYEVVETGSGRKLQLSAHYDPANTLRRTIETMLSL